MRAIHLSLVPRAAASSTTPSDYTLEQLLELLTPSPGEREGPGYIPARLRDGLRGARNVLAVTALVVDVDDVDEDTYAALRAAPAPYWHIGHESYSHRLDKPGHGIGPRARWVFPFATELPLEGVDWGATWDALVAHLGFAACADRACRPSEHLYYLPRHPAEAHREVWQGDGPLLDPLPFTVAARAAPATREVPVARDASPEVLEHARAALRRHGPAITGQHGDAHTLAAATILVHDHLLSDEDAFALLAEWNATLSEQWTDEELRVKLRNARAYPPERPPGESGLGAMVMEKALTRLATRVHVGEVLPPEADDEDVPPTEYGAALEWMCKHFVTVSLTGGGTSYAQIHPRSPPSMLSFTDMRILCARWFVQVPTATEGTRKASLLAEWERQRTRPHYQGLAFCRPGQERPRELNLFQGLAVEPMEGHCSLFRSLMHDVIAAGNDEVSSYLTKWVAWALQNPTKPAETALVLRGGQGTGKSTFTRWLLDIFGAYGLKTSDSGQVAGSFTGHLLGIGLLVSEEATYAGDHAASRRLKDLVTAYTTSIHMKGKAPFTAPSGIKLIANTNEDWAVRADKDDRRFVVLDVSPCKVGDRDFWHALELERATGGLAALLSDFLALDLGGWHPRDERPKTEALEAQKQESLEGVDAWLAESVELERWAGAETLPPTMKDGAALTEDLQWWPTQQLYGWLQAWARVRHSPVPSIKRLGMAMARLGARKVQRRQGQAGRPTWGYDVSLSVLQGG